MNYQLILLKLTKQTLATCPICNGNIFRDWWNVFNCNDCETQFSYFINNNYLSRINIITINYSISFFPSIEDFSFNKKYITIPFSLINYIIPKHKDNSLDEYLNKNIEKWKILI